VLSGFLQQTVIEIYTEKSLSPLGKIIGIGHLLVIYIKIVVDKERMKDYSSPHQTERRLLWDTK
jgi:hypothetical protein